MGLTSTPATEAIMGVVPKAKAGVGSAVNDATRLLGGALGVAVIGSVFASLYGSRLTGTLPAALPAGAAHTAHESLGAALGVVGELARSHPRLATTVHDAASSSFFSGFHTANYLAAAVCAVGAMMALILLPAQPTVGSDDTAEGTPLSSPLPAVPYD
jgi:hypothetical protein